MLMAVSCGGGRRQIRVVAVGDSIMESGSAGETGWLFAYKAAMERQLNAKVTIENVATPGLGSLQIRDAIRTDQRIRDAISSADLVVFDGGINDFYYIRGPVLEKRCGGDGEDCLRYLTAYFEGNWDGIVAEIKALAPTAVLRAADIYYSVSGYDQGAGVFEPLNRYLSQWNAYIAERAASEGYGVAQVHRAFNGESGAENPYTKGFILDDGVHPSPAGHAVIANAFIAAGFGALAEQR